jgi:hypothetical protein
MGSAIERTTRQLERLRAKVWAMVASTTSDGREDLR